ncbi:hypothetical protein Golob_004427, partial [Gossypium lobatum]|nr:hypothetical protein [Gossypium lobatum]
MTVLWFFSKHPKTLAFNIKAIAEFGYFKDFPEILYRILEGPESRKIQRMEWQYRKRGRKRLLFDCFAEFFANYLKSDIKKLNDGKFFDITLSAKWCPSIDSSYDKATLICEVIARRVFPRKSEKESEGLEEAHYVHRVQDSLRKQVFVPMHKALELPKVYMSANKWNSLPYNRVKTGRAKIAAGVFFPHEIIVSLEDEDGREVAELYMFGIPMDVVVALELLVSELSEKPWKGKVITFSANPQLHLVKGG